MVPIISPIWIVWLQLTLDISMNVELSQMWKTFHSNYNIEIKRSRGATFVVTDRKGNVEMSFWLLTNYKELLC